MRKRSRSPSFRLRVEAKGVLQLGVKGCESETLINTRELTSSATGQVRIAYLEGQGGSPKPAKQSLKYVVI